MDRPLARVEDGPLGRWVHGEWRPPHLRGVVERIWLFEGLTASPRERVFPDGTLEIIVQIDGRYRDIRPVDELTPRVCVTGVRTGPAIIEAPAGVSRVLGIRLHPLGATMLFRAPLVEFVDLTVDLRDAIGIAGTELADVCEAAATPHACLVAVADWLARRLARAPAPDPTIAWVCGRIVESRGTARIAHLRERIGWSKAKLAEAFRARVGVTPKRLARVHRFHTALRNLGRRRDSLAGIAWAAGYSDQSHMNADFRAFAGMTPREYLAAARYPGSASVAEDA
jgi:AraC-like DNA-binding protein